MTRAKVKHLFVIGYVQTCLRLDNANFEVARLIPKPYSYAQILSSRHPRTEMVLVPMETWGPTLGPAGAYAPSLFSALSIGLRSPWLVSVGP